MSFRYIVSVEDGSFTAEERWGQDLGKAVESAKAFAVDHPEGSVQICEVPEWYFEEFDVIGDFADVIWENGAWIKAPTWAVTE